MPTYSVTKTVEVEADTPEAAARGFLEAYDIEPDHHGVTVRVTEHGGGWVSQLITVRGPVVETTARLVPNEWTEGATTAA